MLKLELEIEMVEMQGIEGYAHANNIEVLEVVELIYRYQILMGRRSEILSKMREQVASCRNNKPALSLKIEFAGFFSSYFKICLSM